MGLLAASYPDYTVEKGAILAVNFGEQGMQLFNGYTPQAMIYEGLIERATVIWHDYQKFASGELPIPVMEAGPLCGFCTFVGDCPKFDTEEIQELAESVEILTELQKQQKSLEDDIARRKNSLLAIVAERGPVKAHGRFLQKAVRNRRVLDTDRLNDFLKGYDQSLADFQTTVSYSFLDIKKAA